MDTDTLESQILRSSVRWPRFVAAICALLLLLTLGGRPCLAAPADHPWGDEPFTLGAAALLEAARSIPAEEGADFLTLFEEDHISFDSTGRMALASRGIARLETERGVQAWSAFQAPWEPCHQDRPVIRARVVTPDLSEHRLDPETIGEYPATQDEPRGFDDRRVFRAPLPAVAVGAVVEWEAVNRESAPVFDHGVVHYFFPGSGEPTLRSRLVVDAPLALPLRYVARLLPSPEPERTESGDRVKLVFDAGRIESLGAFDPLAPSDDPQRPYVAISTGTSRAEAASAFNRVVDSRIDLPQSRRWRTRL